MKRRDPVTREQPEGAPTVRLDLFEPPEPARPTPSEPGPAGRRGGRRRSRRVLGGAALAVIVGLGALLRFWNLDRVGFRGDEAVYAGQAALLAG